MKKKICTVIIVAIMGLFAVSETGSALSPEKLQEMLEQGNKVTIIDIRNSEIYREGHIPGAISIPAAIISKKQLPPVGAVVVYGDGIRTDLAEEALDGLNAKTGIQAEILEGGFAAWESLNLPTTYRSGFREEKLPYLSYQDLEKIAAGNRDIVLVDMRSIKAGGKPDSSLTDLSAIFPGLSIIRMHNKLRSDGNEWDLSAVTGRVGKDAQYRWLYILIDDGDGEAEKVAHSLKAAGIRRMAILTGGELILRRGGVPGQQN